MRLELWYTLETRDSNGKLKRHIRRKCRSYVRGWIDLMGVSMAGSTISGVNIEGTTSNLDYSGNQFYCKGGAGVEDTGPVVGTGTTAVAISDYALATQIAHGTGSGQLEHGETTIGSPATSGSTRLFTVSRTFTNGSGAAITMNEVGLYVIASFVTAPDRLCACRDIVSGGHEVPNGDAVTLTYTIKVTV